jgi:hypothetical protein
MFRSWPRLVACLSLVAYLLTHTHAGLALHIPIHPKKDPSTSRAEDSNENAVQPPADCFDCPHCAKRARLAAANAAKKPNRRAEVQNTSAPPARQGESKESNSSCPDNPGDPDRPTCPCPEGCAMCSVAKTPCVTANLLLPQPVACLSACLVEEAFLYAPPAQNGVIRPPRV